MKLKPLDDRIIVEAEQSPDTTPGGLVLPDQSREDTGRAKVLAVGPGRLLDSGQRAEMSVKVGETVYLGRFAGHELNVPGHSDKVIRVVREADVLAVE